MSDREDFRRQVFGELTLFFPFSRSGEGEMDEERAVGNEVKREREAILPPPPRGLVTLSRRNPR